MDPMAGYTNRVLEKSMFEQFGYTSGVSSNPPCADRSCARPNIASMFFGSITSIKDQRSEIRDYI